MPYTEPEIRKVAPAARSGARYATTGGGTGRLTGAAAWFPRAATDRDPHLRHGCQARTVIELPDGPPRWGSRGTPMG